MSKCATVRTIPHVEGEQEFVKAVITETNGESITALAIKLGYAPYQGGYPTTWTDPDFSSSPALNQRIVGMLVTQAVPVGEYMLWGQIPDAPEVVVRALGRFNVV